jgi:glycerol kinase
VILAIDQGTTGTRALLFDLEGGVRARAYRELAQHYPRPGWVEHDLQEIWEATVAVCGQALELGGARPGEVRALGITNQRETLCVFDPDSGEPLARAIVWQDRRTARRCEQLRSGGHEQRVRELTGLLLDPYFSATKIGWLLEQDPELAARARRGRARFGTIDSYLAFKLCGEHVSDASNASRTALMDIGSGRWSEELCELFGEIPSAALPEICPSAGVIGRTRPHELHGHAIALAGMAGDQQAALFGHGCLREGEAKNTYGTGSFVLVNAGERFSAPPPGLLETIAWRIGERDTYALEGSIFVTGAAIQWLRDGLGIIAEAKESEELASSLADNEGVYFVPALTGLGSPHFLPEARGAISGLTRGSTRAHLARAALEAIAYQCADVIDAVRERLRIELPELRVDGGASANRFLMQFQADILGVPVAVAPHAEVSALGAAALAGLGAGLISPQDVPRLLGSPTRYEPRIEEGRRERLRAGWARALAAVIAP